MALLHHQSGISVPIVGIEEGNRGRNCEEHDTCGIVVDLDVVVRLRALQIINGMRFGNDCIDDR
jgi:hypothetical protein